MTVWVSAEVAAWSQHTLTDCYGATPSGYALAAADGATSQPMHHDDYPLRAYGLSTAASACTFEKMACSIAGWTYNGQAEAYELFLFEARLHWQSFSLPSLVRVWGLTTAQDTQEQADAYTMAG
eukprot:8128029-Pyramimonas_sp.AAC.1